MLTTYMLALLLLYAGGVSATRFAVLESEWTDCRAINSTQACYRTRDAVCVRTRDNRTASWYYCLETDHTRPHTIEICPQGSCVQDCVVTQWTTWSNCNCEASFYRTRTRDIITPPRNGGKPCPSLQDSEICSECIASARFDQLPRQYTWRTGVWGVCSPLDHCGPGTQHRALECVGLDGLEANVSNCLNELAYTNLVPPTITRLCYTPCNCVVTRWSQSPWSECLPVCDVSNPHTAQTRTRTIIQHPTGGGVKCPQSLSESRVCSDTPPPNCPRYSWSTSDWSDCSHQTDATCGAGQRTRFIYCVREFDETRVNVPLDLCGQLAGTPRPINVMPCHTPCPQTCVLGAWSEWTECPQSCDVTYSNRTREILVPPQGAGGECSHTIELRECPILPCASWITGPYGDCYISPDQDCGFGLKSRAVDCKDLEDNMLNPVYCLEQLQPSRVADCYIPCPEDCVVSDWTSWSDCDHKCGKDLGTQYRTRRLIAVGNNCTYTNENYREDRNCTSTSACEPSSYHLQTGEWSDCVSAPVSSGDSPPDSFVQFDESATPHACETGIQNRTISCMSDGHVITPADCPIEFSPAETQSCDMPCPIACVYSPWSNYSACSVTCGSGVMSRSRQLVLFQDSPQEKCSVNSDGLQFEDIPCDMPLCPPTSSHQWVRSNWSECAVFPSIQTANDHISTTVDPANTACGHGYQTTPVTCIDIGTGDPVSDAMCSQSAPPPTVQPCIEPCPDRCIVSDWTDFGTCSNGSRNRTRVIVSPDYWSCPQLSSLSLVEHVDCPTIDLSSYDYSVLTVYSSIILDDPTDVCGNGYEQRVVACIDISPTIAIYDSEFCRNHDAPQSTAPASIRCETDCVQSDWSAWSECSATCGYGYHTRTRRAMKQPLPGGRPCGHEQETDVCYTQLCLFTEYTPGPYSICEVSNSSSVCGEGIQTRQPICVVNGVEQESAVECERQGTEITFELTQQCDMPCPGECVVSEWGEWSPCTRNCYQGLCQRRRQRTKLRDGEFREECTMTQQLETCVAEVNPYMWLVTTWGNCTLSPLHEDINPGFYCGKGVQRGVVECINSNTRGRVYEGLCEGERPLDVQNCDIPCPVDCVVSAFSEWTACSQTCEHNLNQTRVRHAIIQPNPSGRACPDTHQTRYCPPTDCTVYAVEGHESHCGPDLTAASQCGSAELANALLCRKNTHYVPVTECLSAIDRQEVVIGEERLTGGGGYCDLECPREPNCTYSEWSDWSECTSLCMDNITVFSYRTRVLLSSLDSKTADCEREQYEQRECATGSPHQTNSTEIVPSNMTQTDCISFTWKYLEWSVEGTREIWCQTNTGLRVDNGCPYETTPPTERQSCDSISCPDHSSCDDDKMSCECTAFFELVETVCLPLSGCTQNHHCLNPHTICSGGGVCVCKDGYELMNNHCIYTGPVTTTPPLTTTEEVFTLPDTDPETDMETTVSMVTGTGVTTDPPSPTEGETPSPEAFGILPIALVATVPLIIIIVTVAILIIVMYKCRKSLENKNIDSGSLKRRATISISAPSPLPSSGDELARHRGADSASSGFVDDIMDHDQFKYGMAGKTFLGSQAMPPSSHEDIDEAVFSAGFPNTQPSPRVYPVPVSAPTLPGYQVKTDHTAQFVANLPDGDFTTDVTCTTDESAVTTSVPPSSVGSPPRRRAAGHTYFEDDHPRMLTPSQIAENTYVSMHPIYSQVTPQGQRVQSPGHQDRSYDYREMSYDYRDYRENSHDYRGQPRGQRSRSRSDGRDVYRERGVYQTERERFYSKGSQERSFERISEHRRSPSPQSPTGPLSSYTTPRSNRASSRDRRIATGLDSSLVQAIAQMDPSRDVNATPSVHSVRSSGSRRSHRRSGRRKRYHGHPHHTAYCHGDRYRYNSDGPSDQEQYCTSASEAEQSYNRRHPTSRSAPISPLHPDLDDPNEPDYDVLPPSPPHVQVQSATPINNDRGIPQSPTGLPHTAKHLSAQQPIQGHYDYPRRYQQPAPPTHLALQASPTHRAQQAPSTHLAQAPPTHLAQQGPPTHLAQGPPTHLAQQGPPTHLAQGPPTHLMPQTSTPARPMAYEHLQPLNLSPTVGNQSHQMENPATVHVSPESSPSAIRRQYPPSPLAIHSSSFSDTSGGTPRLSAEVQHALQPRAGQIDTNGVGYQQREVYVTQ